MIGGRMDEPLLHSQMKSRKKYGNWNRKIFKLDLSFEAVWRCTGSGFFLRCDTWINVDTKYLPEGMAAYDNRFFVGSCYCALYTINAKKRLKTL